MIKKEALLKALSEFPDEFSIDDLLEKLLFIQKVERGIEQSQSGQILSEEEARKRMEKWLK